MMTPSDAPQHSHFFKYLVSLTIFKYLVIPDRISSQKVL